MLSQIIDGKVIAERIKGQVKAEIAVLAVKHGKKPLLKALQMGDNPASKMYVKNQKESCEEIGMEYELVQLPEDVTEDRVIQVINDINKDNSTGLIIQMPVPKQVNAKKLQMMIAPEKDVEGVTPTNLGKLLYSEVEPIVAPCTALSVIECLKDTKVELKGKETVIVGHSEIVGKPVLLMLLSSLMGSVTPTVCHIATKDLQKHTSRADLLVVAAGKAGLVTGAMVKEGAIVIDVGINRVPQKDDKGNPVLDEKTGKPKMKTVGDVLFDEAKEKASFITPVPGGVGAVTTVLLTSNLLHLWKIQLGEPAVSYKIL